MRRPTIGLFVTSLHAQLPDAGGGWAQFRQQPMVVVMGYSNSKENDILLLDFPMNIILGLA